MLLNELGAAPVILALLYLVAFIYAAIKVRKLRRKTAELDTKMLFASSILLACLSRFMGFVTIGALNFQSIRIGYDPSRQHQNFPEDEDQRFYDKTVLVLFDFPDFVIVSAYVLLAVVWAESFLHSRRHWLSARVYRRNWILFYLVFNTVLYAGQIVLYSLLFLPTVSRETTLYATYITLTVINFFLPVLLLSIFLYLSCALSGFPYKSVHAIKRLRRVGRLVLWWTVARIVWGVFALTTALDYTNFIGDLPAKLELYSVLIVALFLVTELAPFALALEDSLLNFLASDETPVVGRSPYDQREQQQQQQQRRYPPASVIAAGGGGGRGIVTSAEEEEDPSLSPFLSAASAHSYGTRDEKASSRSPPAPLQQLSSSLRADEWTDLERRDSGGLEVSQRFGPR